MSEKMFSPEQLNKVQAENMSEEQVGQSNEREETIMHGKNIGEENFFKNMNYELKHNEPLVKQLLKQISEQNIEKGDIVEIEHDYHHDGNVSIGKGAFNGFGREYNSSDIFGQVLIKDIETGKNIEIYTGDLIKITLLNKADKN